MFNEIDFMTPLREFLVEYPALKPGDSLEINYMDVDLRLQQRSEGGALAFVGSTVVNEQNDILGNSIHTEQTNFILILRRHTTDNELRRDMGNFLMNYIRWINYEQTRRGTSKAHPKLPKFSMTHEEKIRANGGIQTGVELKPGVDEYQIQIQCLYQTVYEAEY